ncbi:MAG: class I SAM-dependent methyltransferase [Candidatus Omnitrophica bacterium]|nr:class I SAM-dependent methyltransferase [Candidatus Omnitrophota bacterium]MBU1997684.1 class I SAM-dependent methyltransferase [Candidatus Omnitrophota bacterium]
MSENHSSLETFWNDEVYCKGMQLNRYPHDIVVSFVFYNRPKEKPVGDTKILEVGCGAGNNMWFTAREGFQVTGVDLSPKAIDVAKKRLEEDGLSGDLHIGEFTDLPFESESFDLAIDRAAITCVGITAAKSTIAEIHRVLKPKGKLLFNPYSKKNSSFLSGKTDSELLTRDMKSGPMTYINQLCFYDEQGIRQLFSKGWDIISMKHAERIDIIEPDKGLFAEWQVVVERSALG